jgi:hypothetical protein
MTDRVLDAIRTHYRHHGRGPSLSKLARLAAKQPQHIRRFVDRLEREGLVEVKPGRRGEPCVILLVDRVAMLSDAELEAGAHGRGWTVVKPGPMAQAVGQAWPADPRIPPDQADLLDRL